MKINCTSGVRMSPNGPTAPVPDDEDGVIGVLKISDMMTGRENAKYSGKNQLQCHLFTTDPTWTAWD
jgi:hypothetical protein